VRKGWRRGGIGRVDGVPYCRHRPAAKPQHIRFQRAGNPFGSDFGARFCADCFPKRRRPEDQTAPARPKAHHAQADVYSRPLKR
jgi:hypothetical protein